MLFTGRLVELGIAKETDRGTCVAPTHWIPKTAITFDDKAQDARTVGSYGNITDAAMTGQVVNKWAEGDIEGEVNVNSFGLFLLALVGAVSSSGISDSAYTHTFTLQNDNLHDSLTLTVKDPDDSFRFCRAMINSLRLDFALGEFVNYAINFMSRMHMDIATPTPSYSTDKRFVHPDLTFKIANTVDDIAAASKISLKSLTLTIEKEVERIDVLGSLEPEDIVNKTIRITGSFELNLEDKTYRDYMMNGTVKAMQIKLVSSTLIGATSRSTLDFIFPKVWFSGWEPSRALGDIASQSINFDVLYDLSNSRVWSTMQLINETVSY